MEEKIYLFNSGGFTEVPEVAYQYIAESSYTTEYDKLFDGFYIRPTEEQITWNLAHPGLDIYRAYNMIEKTAEEENEEIRQTRQSLYAGQTDKLYMAYIKYKEFGDEAKAAEAYEAWKAAVEKIEKDNPYV